VTDKHEGLLDAAQQAVKLAQLDGAQQLLAQRVSSGMEAVTSTLASVQLEVRGLSTKIGELAGLQHSHDSNKEAIDKIERTVGGLVTKLEGWFDDFDERNNRRWEAHEANRDAWRREHEAENEDDHRALTAKVQDVRETVIRVIAIGSAIGTLSGVIVAGFLWNVNYRFENQDKTIQDRKEASSYNRSLYDKLNEEMVEVQLYLARGGRIPEEPFNPRNSNEQRRPQQDASGQPGK